MKFVGLDGQEYSVALSTKHNDNCSALHIRCRNLLKAEYPCERILEEFIMPGAQGMVLDFYVPLVRLAVECQGEQHYKFNNYFHKNKLAFYKAQNRDRVKRQWCEINGITLVEFVHNESDAEFVRKLRSES